MRQSTTEERLDVIATELEFLADDLDSNRKPGLAADLRLLASTIREDVWRAGGVAPPSALEAGS